MITCTLCGEEKENDQFYWQNKEHSLKDNRCKKCHVKRQENFRKERPERVKINAKNHYDNNRERINLAKKSRRKIRKDANMKWLNDNYKLSCYICGYSDSFVALDAHHLDPDEKLDKLDSMGLWLDFSLDKFTKKVKSTNFLFLCRNCHMRLHVGEFSLLIYKEDKWK
jgi:hypothetical protein